jgi:proline iminopeptidase
MYPITAPYDSGFLRVSNLHEIYYEQVGNPRGRPVVFLHGGPGGGIQPEYRTFFDPESYRVVLLDQRGCGQSKPHAELRENTTWDLVDDLEKLREHLGIHQWLVFGGSWGSTLALSYASRYADSISGMILRGIFLCRPKEIHWFYQYGASLIFPEAWDVYRSFIPEEERGNYLKAYHTRMNSSDPELRLEAARRWSKWEAACSKLYVDQNLIDHYDDPEKALAFGRIETHYFINNAFFETDNYLIEQVNRYRHIPTKIVQGRYDMVCPVISAYELHQAWPDAELHIVPDAGHSVFESGIKKTLLQWMDELR